jgi:2-aminomuconate deaminase
MAVVPRSVVVAQNAQALARYPHAKIVGDLVFVSGISSRRLDNTHAGVTIHPDGRVEKNITEQTRAVLQNIRIILQECGADLHDVVDITVFLTDMNDYAAMNAVYNEHFSAEQGPARTTVGVRDLPHPNLLVEMKAMAVLRGAS